MSVVTSVIPVYNGEKFLPKALQLLERQSRRPDRIIVLDNCSTDATGTIARECGLANCEHHRNETNIGMVGNFNRALDFSSQTDFLHILPVDDLIGPEFFARLLPLIESVPGRALASAVAVTADREELLPNRALGLSGKELSLKRFLARQAAYKHVCCPAVLLKTNREAPPCCFRPELGQFGDVIFFAEWAQGCRRIVRLSETLSLHLHHRDSATADYLADPAKAQALVRGEWRAMEIICSLIQEDPFSAWVRRQKLKCLFAARSRVKMNLAKSNRDYAAAIRQAAAECVSPAHWLLGSLAVLARDMLYKVTWREPEAYRLAKGGRS